MRPKKILHRTELTSNRLYLNIPGGSRGFFYPPLKASVLRRKKIPKQSVSPWFLSFSTTFVRRNLSFPPRSFSTFCQTSRSKTPWARSNPTSIYVYPSSLRLDTRARSLFSILFRRIFFRRNRGNRFPSLSFPFLPFRSFHFPRSPSLLFLLSPHFFPPLLERASSPFSLNRGSLRPLRAHHPIQLFLPRFSRSRTVPEGWNRQISIRKFWIEMVEILFQQWDRLSLEPVSRDIRSVEILGDSERGRSFDHDLQTRNSSVNDSSDKDSVQVFFDGKVNY